jgi:hypothetical protein
LPETLNPLKKQLSRKFIDGIDVEDLDNEKEENDGEE